MKKLRNITLIAAVVVLAFGLLSKIIAAPEIKDFVWGFSVGMAVTFLIAGIGFAMTPVFCKKKKAGSEEPGKDAKQEEKKPREN